jgi:sec-independent protein translocase protein TatA
VREGREEIMPIFAVGIGPPEIAIIAVVLVLLFGVGKLSGVGGAIGKSVREFRRELKDDQDEEEQAKASSELEEKEKVEATAEEEKKV